MLPHLDRSCRSQSDISSSQSFFFYTGPISPNADPITADAWHGSHWRTNLKVTGIPPIKKKKKKRSTAKAEIAPRGQYHGGRRPSSDDSLHNPTVILPSALDKPSIMKRCHRSANVQSRLTSSFADDDSAS